MGSQRQELIGCHDCGQAVSFSAAWCPHCGSREHTGPPMVIRDRVEQRNDQTLIGMLVLCTGVGFFFGALTGGVLPAVAYGIVGALIGIPGGFIINLSRRLFG